MAQQIGKGSLVVGALAAISASVCCVGPLALLELGISGTSGRMFSHMWEIPFWGGRFRVNFRLKEVA
jgi:hypothetical protein